MAEPRLGGPPPRRPAVRPGGLRGVLLNPWVWAFLAGITTLTLMRPFLRHEPAPPPVLGELPPFSLVDAAGAPYGSADLEGQVWVASFFFTRCVSICPLLTRSMARLQEAYEEAGIEGIRLVSITVDPGHDTPEILQAYSSSHGADPRRWTFLTGTPDEVRDLVVGGFRLAVGEATSLEGELIDIAHSGRVVLVDRRGAIRGYYDTDEMGLDEVFHRSRHVLAEES